MLIFQKATIIPKEAGRVLSMCSFRDKVLLACERGIWEIVEDDFGNYTARRVLPSLAWKALEIGFAVWNSEHGEITKEVLDSLKPNTVAEQK